MTTLPKFAALVLTVLPLLAGAADEAKPWFSVRDGQMYGYEPTPNALDALRGNKAAAMAMVGYNGTRDGVHQVMMLQKPKTVIAMQCGTPCEFAKTMVFEGGKHQASSTARVVHGTLAWMIFQDAASGHLQRYVDRRQPATPYHIWCDEAGGCNATAAPKSRK